MIFSPCYTLSSLPEALFYFILSKQLWFFLNQLCAYLKKNNPEMSSVKDAHGDESECGREEEEAGEVGYSQTKLDDPFGICSVLFYLQGIYFPSPVVHK